MSIDILPRRGILPLRGSMSIDIHPPLARVLLRYAPRPLARSGRLVDGVPRPPLLAFRPEGNHPPLGQCELDMMDVLLWRTLGGRQDSYCPPGGKQRLFMTTDRYKKALLPRLVD